MGPGWGSRDWGGPVTNYLMEDARNWLLDCFADPFDAEQIGKLGPRELLLAVERYYSGGWAAFLKDAS